MTLIKTKTLLFLARTFQQASYAKIRASLQFADWYCSETKRIILVKNVVQQTNQYLRFVSGRYRPTNCIQDAPIVYFMARGRKVDCERKAWQELLECLFHCNTGTLRQQSCLYPVPYQRQTVTPKCKGLQ